MNFEFSSSSYMSNSKTSIQINLPPFEIDSIEYLKYISFLSKIPICEKAQKYLRIKPQLIVEDGEYTSFDGNTKVYELDQTEQNKLRELIKSIKIVNFVDDISSLHVMDGGDFRLTIESPNMALSYFESNLSNGVAIEGWEELYEAIELIMQRDDK